MALFFISKTLCTSWYIVDSCEGRCGASLDRSRECQCNTACTQYGDCCVDYSVVCNAGKYHRLGDEQVEHNLKKMYIFDK